MILAIASGKGGTGKTTVAVNLAVACSCRLQLLDCDVEEPNAQLFLKGVLSSRETVCMRVPEVDASLCNGCGACARFCRYGAIVAPKGPALVFPEMCHACGGCALVCTRGAIREVDRPIGVIETFSRDSLMLHQGLLDVGAALAPPLIQAVKGRLVGGGPAIIDAPPGTACPVVAALRGSDFAVLVTEPTPFGLYDLELAVKTVRELNIPLGVVLNRAGAGDDRVNLFCREQGISLLAEIPDDRRIAELYSRGELLVEKLPEYRALFEKLWDGINRTRETCNSVSRYQGSHD